MAPLPQPTSSTVCPGFNTCNRLAFDLSIDLLSSTALVPAGMAALFFDRESLILFLFLMLRNRRRQLRQQFLPVGFAVYVYRQWLCGDLNPGRHHITWQFGTAITPDRFFSNGFTGTSIQEENDARVVV